MKRPLVAFSLVYIFGIVGADLCARFAIPLVAAAVPPALAVACFLARRAKKFRQSLLLPAALALFFLLAFFLRGAQADLPPGHISGLRVRLTNLRVCAMVRPSFRSILPPRPPVA